MDQWNEPTWLDRSRPTLRAVSGRSVRVLPRPDDRYAYEDRVSGGPHPIMPEQLSRPASDGDLTEIRVLVVADDVLARRGVLAALDGQPGLTVVGERRSGPGVSAVISSLRPDVLLLHGLPGREAVPTLKAARLASRTLAVLSIGGRGEHPDAEPQDGICGSLPAWASPDEVVAAVRMAAAGYVLSRAPLGRARAAIAAEAAAERGRTAVLRDGLTERECDVLTLVAKGMTNAEIAKALTVSEHTVKSHVQNLLGKLSLRNRIHAVIYAFETGLARRGPIPVD
jgi:DNA-binding NarL/FixJ family response regulator